MKRIPSDVPSALMTVTELSEYLRVHPSTVYRLLQSRGLPALKVGRNWRFSLEQVNRWCMEHEDEYKDKPRQK